MVDESTKKQSKGRFLATAANRRYLWIAALCAASLIASYYVRLAGVLVPASVFLPIHVILEASSIVVGFAVFVTGWFGYRQSGDTRDLFLGAVFLATGILDFVHTFTYQGMPYFFGATGVEKATTFWTIARLCTAVGLLAACFVNPKSRSKLLTPGVLLVGAVMLALTLAWLVLHQYPSSAALFYNVESKSLTGLKISAEYLIIAMFAATFILCTKKMGWEESKIVPLRSALLVAIFGEMAFTMYSSPFALTNFLGHLFKTWAYYLILGALFVSSIRRPYEELTATKEELMALYEDAREHRKEIEQSFARIGSALSSSIRLDEALGQIADLAIEMLHADCSVVASLPRGSNTHQISAQRGDTHIPGRAIDVAVATGKKAAKEEISSVLNNNLKDSGWIECHYKSDKCLRSIVCAPMYFEGEALGVVAVYGHQFDAFDEGDRKLLEGFASHAAVAIHNAMIYERESRIADVLQRTFVSPAEHVSEKFEIAQFYASAMEEAKVGGDFYDVIDLGNGKLGLVIGDVSGKGLAAAVHTAMAKYSMRAYLLEGHTPGKALALLDKTLTESTNIETFITIFCAVLDTRTGDFAYASGGHEPALYCRGDSAITALDSTGPAVGLGIGIAHRDESIRLEPGSVLLMYTDGVTEARRGHSFLGTEGVSQRLVACSRESSEDIARRIYQAAVEHSQGEVKDDIAILVVKAIQ